MVSHSSTKIATGSEIEKFIILRSWRNTGHALRGYMGSQDMVQAESELLNLGLYLY